MRIKFSQQQQQQQPQTEKKEENRSLFRLPENFPKHWLWVAVLVFYISFSHITFEKTISFEKWEEKGKNNKSDSWNSRQI